MTNIVAMLDAGMMVTVNSDDPAYFGGYATDNFAFLMRVLAPGVAKSRACSLSDVYRLVRNGVLATFLRGDARWSLLGEVDAYFLEEPGVLAKCLKGDMPPALAGVSC
jgi:adenosine deaminase